MATIQTEARAKTRIEPRNTRRNEIVAIALFALGLLLTLCLVFFNPDDTSLNASGQTETRNLIGPVGAYISDALLQAVGLAAYLLPLLLFATAWRRFRTRRIHAPLSRIVGLVILLLSSAALLAVAGLPLLFDKRVQPGGAAGTLVALKLSGALNTVGAGVLLLALAAVGLLLATNFSFTHAYEKFVEAFGHPSDFLRAQQERFNNWRTHRRELAQARAEERQAARAAREAELKPDNRSGAERVAEYMRGDASAATTETGAVSASAAIQRSAAVVDEHEEVILAKAAQLAQAEAELASIFVQPSFEAPLERKNGGASVESAEAKASKRVAAPARSKPPVIEDEEGADAAEIEEMLRTASVVRLETEDAPEAEAEEAFAGASNGRASKRAEEEAAATFDDYKIPDVDLLVSAVQRHEQAEEELRQLGRQVAEKCREFNVTGKIEYICPGPVVTTYEFKPDPGVKYSRVTGLVDDLCLALKAESIRIDRVPGKAHVGIEVPNPQRETIYLREVVESRAFRESESKLTIALGKTIDGMNYVADLTRMPHLLIAGATGTGKSVCLNSLVVSILYKARPDEVKFIMIDPKRLELGLYADIPHLATPIITEPKRAANALKWAVAEMERRYKELAGWSVRNIDGYNNEIARRNLVEEFDEEGRPWKPLPYIVIIIDELADLMMVSGHEVEEAITRLAQMARAVGIHLVLATQRPSVDVITGLIKANFPSRIAFRVSSKVDSRTIIDANGAEQLLGRGDMLFLPPGTSRLIRVHGAYLDEAEVGRIVSHIKQQSEPVYDESITQSDEEAAGGDGAGGVRDELFEQALRICVEMKRASTSVLQRRLRIGYGRAAAILDAMEREGFIGQADGARPRPVLGRGFETVAHWDDLQANDADAT
ncbi:MAG TPA: DNA translocase FtsK 4TM domain-containing protein [Pyrinomonadaceae bacterium]|nr:DNA translocase FtsK 4TM domain-containing protein [Pyrinomonadaceae bacterium]